MAQYCYEILLSSGDFPMLSEQRNRTVISPVNDDDDPFYPGVIYCHNVLPSEYGYDAVGYTQEIDSTELSYTSEVFSSILSIYSETLEHIYIGITSKGVIYALKPEDGPTEWTFIKDTTYTTDVTVGTVNGVSYFMFAGTQVYTYDSDEESLTEITLTSIEISEINGICDSSGYLIVYSDEEIAWSSTISETDFDPDDVTGAGGGSVSSLAGNIVFVSTTSTGILIHSDGNAIAGTYTGSSSYPFKFTEVTDSKGLQGLKYISRNDNSEYQYLYSKAGIQTINSTAATTQLAQVTDFLAGKRFEVYDEDTNEFVITSLGDDDSLDIRMNYLSSRYVVLSYGVRDGDTIQYTAALVYDGVLERLGKLLIDHVDVIDYYADQTSIAKASIAFLKSDGSMYLLDNTTSENASGVLVAGKIQPTHSRRAELASVEVENIPEDYPLTCIDLASQDGKTVSAVESRGTGNNADGIREFMFRSSAKSHSIALIGSFNLVTLNVWYAIGARR